MAQVYDSIGRSYTRHRRSDPRIGAQILRALGEAPSVVNVGAGTGSYEPRDRLVVAVEPSDVMIGQRPRDAAPVVKASAEALPFGDHGFAAALAIFTLHHWTDAHAGLRELARVARRQVVLTWDPDPELTGRFWLTRDYVPAAAECQRSLAALPAVLDVLGPPARVETVLVPHDCSDGFFGAYWRRPGAYLDPAVRASISGLALLDDGVLRPGLDRLAADLASGEWARRNRELLGAARFDAGYRLVVAGEV